MVIWTWLSRIQKFREAAQVHDARGRDYNESVEFPELGGCYRTVYLLHVETADCLMNQSDRTIYRKSVNDHFDYLFPYPASENAILRDAEREFICNDEPIPHELFDVSNWLCREEDTISVRALATLKATAIENAAIAEEAETEGEAVRLVEEAVSKEGSGGQTNSATSIQKSVPPLTTQAMASVAEM